MEAYLSNLLKPSQLYLSPSMKFNFFPLKSIIDETVFPLLKLGLCCYSVTAGVSGYGTSEAESPVYVRMPLIARGRAFVLRPAG